MKSLQNIFSLIFQLSLLSISYFVYNYYFSESFLCSKPVTSEIAILFISWLITAWLTHKYKPQYYQRNWFYIIAPFFKGAVFTFLIIFLLSITILELNYKQGLLFKIAFIYLFSEIIIYSAIVFIKGVNKSNSKSPTNEITKYTQEDLAFDESNFPSLDFLDITENLSFFSKEIIEELYLPHGKPNKALRDEILILKSYKEETNQSGPFSICISDLRINDFKNINSYLKKVYGFLKAGGYLLTVFEDLEDFENDFFKSKSKLIRFFKLIFYYKYYRALPKIPYLNYIYHIFSGGRNKVISKAETLGRLFYCGFSVEKELKKNGLTYLVARKSLTFSENPNPSFYPIITLNRVGLYGNIIKIHKVRSMYPYSEFLQKKVFEEGNINSIGKFGNDFRVTRYGKLYRKYWIDELPQIIDWFRGKIKLVGIRAMSQHFFSLYPEEYKELYLKVKPGIISPIFDENTAGFEDIVRIEKEYLENFIKNPIKTDFKYFFITLNHIFKGVRSK